ncbi:aspartate/glutamate racemase family protein [Bradyrhizobium sp. dw_78]|uniref:maleate cis-trans isomerase family protein n=1 Tax=Bradyrhizobium sp. dw_78 TaxID=2719793 RepID=UPI001BD2D92F|nr:aspartate/glutamate racemase family protein [Bradyrhizobium sp. dw_78]
MTQSEKTSGRAKSDRRTRIALLVPSSNTIMENDLHSALPREHFTVHTDRMFLVETTRDAEIRMIEDYAAPAAKDLATVNPDLLVFGCTSAGSLFGLEYDAATCRNLGELAGCPALGVVNSVSDALARIDARRIAVITPYIEDLTRSVADALKNGNREIVAAHGMGISVNVELADPTPGDIVRFAKEKLEGVSFDTLFVSCTNFRSLEAKKELEALFGVNVVTSNSSVIDAIIRRFVPASAS